MMKTTGKKKETTEYMGIVTDAKERAKDQWEKQNKTQGKRTNQYTSPLHLQTP